MLWIGIAVAIEGMALLGVLSVWKTRRTLGAFVTGFNTMAIVTAIYAWQGGLDPRTVLVVGMVAAYLARMNWVLFAWSDQTALSKLDSRTPALQKMFLPVILANTAGWGYCLPVYFAATSSQPLGRIDVLAMGVYVIGTIFHFGGDYQKHRFKLHKGHDREVLDSGLWSFCRHPNYFGDFLIYISLAMVGGSLWGWLAPLSNLLQYVFDAIPKSERWAMERYGPAWEAYRAKTKSFIPYLV